MLKKYLCMFLSLAMLAAVMTVPASAEKELPFTDVKETDWFYDSVSYAFENSLMAGTSQSRFEPQTPMSRAMFITVIGRLYGAEENESNNFIDVEKGSWYSGYVGWASDNGIVYGYEDNTFKPNLPVTREEAAACLSRYISFDSLLLDWTHTVPDELFKDEDLISSWAAGNVAELNLSSIIIGDDKGRFNPSSHLTRAEAATILMRLDEATKESANSSAIVSAYDLINTPEMMYSNMDSVLDEQNEYPIMSLTPHQYYSAPWYVGINYIESDINAGALEYTKICYKSESGENPYLTVTSPVYSSDKLSPEKVSDENGYTTAVFKTGDLIRNHRKSYLSLENPYEEYGKSLKIEALVNLNMLSLNSTYLKIAVYPFGDEAAPSADILYFAFFSNEKDAEAFTASKESDYFLNGKDDYPEADIEQVGEEVVSRYTNDMNKRTEEIISTENAVVPEDFQNSRCYYVSSINGDDDNDGLSPDTPWKSISMLYTIKGGGTVWLPKIEPGDAVFFERGSVFYPFKPTNHSGDYTLPGESGVTYAAYGEGPKPIFTNALDINGSMDWEETAYENVWKLKDSDKILAGKEDSPGYNDVGNIIVTDKDGNTGWGVKLTPMDPANPYAEGSVTWDIGVVSNGFETFDSSSVPCENPSVVRHNLEYFHDLTDGSLYMYYDGGNPGKIFDSIIVSRRGDIMAAAGVDILVDNLSFKYTGSHGISTGDASNFTVQNCTFEWIGGSLQNDKEYIPGSYGSVVRFGNGFQNWGNCDGLYVKNCYFNQIYDGAVSTQVAWADVSIVNDFDIVDCVLKNSNSPVEIWNLAHDEVSANVTVSGNYFANNDIEKRYGAQRIDGGTNKITYKSAAFISLSSLDMITHERFVVEDNIFFMNSSRAYAGRQFLFRGDDNGVMTRRNVFIGGIEGASDTFATLPDVDLRNGGYPPNSYEIRYNYIGYTKEFITKWTSLGCDRGSKFYFIK